MPEIDQQLMADMTSLNERLNNIIQSQQEKLPDVVSQRLMRLEERLDRVWDDHAETKKHAAILEERIAHLPTKPDLWKALAALFVAFSAVIAFAEKLQGLVK